MTHSEPEPTISLTAEEQDALLARKDLMARKSAALEGLNKRIARLGIALGLELDTDVGLRMALTPDVTPEPHLHQFMDELRALLTLRYQMEDHLVEEVGSQATHQIVADVELHMERIGFKHGVDGTHGDHPIDANL
jgi:hypothetical protein